MSDIFQTHGQGTLITEEEKADLIPTYITTQGELNEAEQENILAAEYWAFKKKNLQVDSCLHEGFVRRLHEKMFCEVWRWAGHYRGSDKNIGISHFAIRPSLQQHLGDVLYWVHHKTYPPDEIAVRLHHQLVYIHPFPNGNGRHGRLMADIIVTRLGGKRFSWGGERLYDGDPRQQYIEALKEADRGNMMPLLRASRS